MVNTSSFQRLLLTNLVRKIHGKHDIHIYSILSNCRGGWYKRGGLAISKN